LRVLIASHTAVVSGAEHALLDLLRFLPDEVEPLVAGPEGALSRRVRELGVATAVLPATTGSFRLHPVHTPVGAAQTAAAALATRRLARKRCADLVHANTVRAGLSAVAATRAGGPPVVVHAHDLVPAGRAGDAVRWTLRGARRIVAVSDYAAATLGPRLGRVTEVLHNPLDLERFDPERVDRERSRRTLGLPLDAPVLGVVAQITPWKGQDTAIECLRLVREQVPDAQLVLAGKVKFASAATRFDNPAYMRELEATVARHELARAVHFVGERDDIPDVLAALDLLLVPSTGDPFPRVVIEALAVGTPVIATTAGGPAEALADGAGRLLPPGQPAAWAAAAVELLRDPRERQRLSEHGRRRALRFDARAYAERMVEVWRDAACQPSVRGCP
jgi:glycosyltransferase involved in cell wall biosynthesis